MTASTSLTMVSISGIIQERKLPKKFIPYCYGDVEQRPSQTRVYSAITEQRAKGELDL